MLNRFGFKTVFRFSERHYNKSTFLKHRNPIKEAVRNRQLSALPGKSETLKNDQNEAVISMDCKVPLGGTPNSHLTVGQPTYKSHPHILRNGEVTPGIEVKELQERRHRLLESIEKFSPQSDMHIVVIPASPKKYMTEKIPYVFRQDSDFMYLSGCLEPDSCLLLTSNRTIHESIMFLRGKDAHAELWDGPRTGTDQAMEMFGVDRGMLRTDLSIYLESLLRANRNSSIWFDYLGGVNQQVYSIIKDLTQLQKASLDSPRTFIHRLRLIKSKAEQELMRKTCAVGSEAIIRTMKSAQPGINEAHLFAKVDYEGRMLGAQYLAYPPVIAGGNRANIIHYISNNQIVNPGELVLMDAGVELNGYTSDITRTWPISGKWSTEQRELYELLHNVQLQLLKEVESRPTLNQLFHIMCSILGKGLQELGAISSSCQTEDDLARAAYAFCPHHVSHYLGMDVHDTSSVARDSPLQPGMVFTVEPGIYVNSNNKLANPKYHGLGMRIEDDILITDAGVEVLTASCPKHPDDIETLLSKS